MPACAAAGRLAHCNLWSARAHRRHTYGTVLPATIDGIRAHFGNPTEITLLRMPVSAGSPHLLQDAGSVACGDLFADATGEQVAQHRVEPAGDLVAGPRQVAVPLGPYLQHRPVILAPPLAPRLGAHPPAR